MLLKLGLKKETADMSYNYQRTSGDYELSVNAYADILSLKDRMNNRKVLGMGWDELWGNDLPAWSLHRLIEMMPRTINHNGNDLWLTIHGSDVFYTDWKEHTPLARTLSLYEHIVWYIEWLIKEGYFPKEYLV